MSLNGAFVYWRAINSDSYLMLPGPDWSEMTLILDVDHWMSGLCSGVFLSAIGAGL
jgi:hypothetical protein